ncbi:hypothetical protein HG536_0A03200 [Torulaspora globosa]|uniref:Pyruvate decarboxylase n=1 Tax=Torulaspora globosa TaxID=48254 RepID=A0A7G3ZAG6_9SACH|nr:uncharacterized protein HG536_0A03200 [Torulaspora globosa]QLL30502.1 hypothetical protein HG536_0A03200 [Torulaspora globosa]
MNYTRSNELPHDITLGEFLFHRFKQLHSETIFGLPGAFNTQLLDKLAKVPGLRWAGNTNELNAAYAADGYARLKGIACMITTFGVGELSAINGVAGSFAEHVGLLHVVGMPPTSAQTKQLLLNHTLGNGDYKVFYRIASEVACYSTLMADQDLCAEEVDDCITRAWILQKPVYLGIPINLIETMVSSAKLDKPLNLKLPPNDKHIEEEVVNQILQHMYKAKNPVIISDACVIRHHVVAETTELSTRTRFPVYTTPMGKGAIDESLPNFGGVFMGSISPPEVREVVNFADFVLVVGCMLADFSTSSFHFGYKTKECALLFPTSVKFKHAIYPDLHIKSLLEALLRKLDESKIKYKCQPAPPMIIPKSQLPSRHTLRHEWIWNQMSNWFQQGDIIITETGTSAFGINQTHFPYDSRGISQALWGSVGYTVGACLGACFAVDEMAKDSLSPVSRRVILFVGDGALQLTVQEVSTMVRWGLKPYIFIMNNQGYSVDRFLHHRSNASYYDIQTWDYLRLLATFGARSYEARKIVTVGDFLEMVQDPHFARNDKIRMLEIMLPPMDVPQALMDRWLTEQESKKRAGEETDAYTPSPESSLKRIRSDDLTPTD